MYMSSLSYSDYLLVLGNSLKFMLGIKLIMYKRKELNRIIFRLYIKNGLSFEVPIPQYVLLAI